MYTRPGSRSAYVQVPTSPYIRIRIRPCTEAVCGIATEGGGSRPTYSHCCALSWQDFRGAVTATKDGDGDGIWEAGGGRWRWEMVLGFGWHMTNRSCMHTPPGGTVHSQRLGLRSHGTERSGAERSVSWAGESFGRKPQRRYGSWLRRRRRRYCSSSSADPQLEPLAQVRVQETGAEIHWADVKSKFRPCSFTELPRN